MAPIAAWLLELPAACVSTSGLSAQLNLASSSVRWAKTSAAEYGESNILAELERISSQCRR